MCDELLERDYPPELLILGYLAHAAPRILKVGTSLGPVITHCSNSILAGDQQSVSWSRGVLWKLLDKLSLVDPEYPCAVHVDDLSHVLVGESASDLRKKLLSAGRTVGSEVKRLHLTLSDKSTLLPDNANTRCIAKLLSDEGICLKTANSCNDVGVQMSGSALRKASSLNKRTL